MNPHLPPLSVFLLMLGASAVPGPSDFLMVATALSKGVRGCMRVLAGILLGDALFIVCAFLGLFTLESLVQGGALFLRLAGYAFLLWIVLAGLRSDATPAVESRSDRGALTGFLVTLSDPTAIGFYAAILPMMTGGRPLRPADALMLFACAVAAVSTVKLTYAFLAIRLGRFPVTNENQMRLRKGFYVLLVAVVLFFAISEFL